MKHIIRLTDAEKEAISIANKQRELNKIKIEEDLICNALITSFYKQNFITEAECTLMRNSLSSGTSAQA